MTRPISTRRRQNYKQRLTGSSPPGGCREGGRPVHGRDGRVEERRREPRENHPEESDGPPGPRGESSQKGGRAPCPRGSAWREPLTVHILVGLPRPDPVIATLCGSRGRSPQ